MECPQSVVEVQPVRRGTRVQAHVGEGARADHIQIAVVIEVADTGPGIPEDELECVWEELYRGKGARGVPGSGLGLAKFPRVSGQHAAYADQTLKHFRDGTRANDPNGMMRGVSSRMTDQEIAAVSQYIQGLSQ